MELKLVVFDQAASGMGYVWEFRLSGAEVRNISGFINVFAEPASSGSGK